MPVPGGALFSAPMVDEEGEKYKLTKNQKNYLNVWFRHIWFPIYPISSAMILICSIEFSNIEIYTLMIINTPAFLISIIIGLFFLKRFLNINESKREEEHKNRNISGLKFLFPPIIPLLTYAFLWVFGLPQIRAFLIGIILSLFSLYFLLKIPFKEFASFIKKSFTFKLALAIFGIMIFRQMISISYADILIADLIEMSNIPGISMIVLIPLILGVLTGYNLGATALSYPIVQPFFPQPIDDITLIGITSLIFISSLIGYLISPIHLCNVLSSDYLKTDTTRMYKMYIPSAITMLLVQIAFVSLIITLF
jgi:integral membrane protein (TIGR00529 family)